MVQAITIEEETIREGVFIPQDLLTKYTSIEIKITAGHVTITNPQKRSWAEIRRDIDRRREALKAKHGLFPDSTPLIREDRDSR